MRTSAIGGQEQTTSSLENVERRRELRFGNPDLWGACLSLSANNPTRMFSDVNVSCACTSRAVERFIAKRTEDPAFSHVVFDDARCVLSGRGEVSYFFSVMESKSCG